MESTGRLRSLRVTLEMIKFEHSVFALPFAYMGAFLAARGLPGWRELFWITIAMVGARSFAMGLNRLIDRRIDARNPRTQNRALPLRLVSQEYVVAFSLVSLVIFALATFQLAPLARLLLPFFIVPLAFYSFTKRFTWLNHIILGISLGLAPIGAWVAVTNSLDWVVLLVGLAVALWVAGFDVIYACQDLAVDLRDGLFSIPARFGVGAALNVTRVFHTVAVLLLLAVGGILNLRLLYYLGIGLTAVLLAYENSLVSKDDLSRVDTAFFTMNGVISIIVFAFTAISLAA